MDLENLVQSLASKIPSSTVLRIATDGHGVDLCLDKDGHWHEQFSIVDQDHGRAPIEKVLLVFAVVRKYVAPCPEDREFSDYFARAADYVETNKQKLIDELEEVLRQIDQTLTS